MDWPFSYAGNLPWLMSRTILLTNHGSRAYGTSTPTSDYDYKGVAVTPKAYRNGFLNRFEQAEIKDPEANSEATIYNLSKFMALAADANPSFLEVLWMEPDNVYHVSPEGELLQAHREDFLSKKILYTFRGYAIQQLRRIQSHRKWLLSPPAAKPDRESYDLLPRNEVPSAQINAALAAIQKQLDSWSIDFGNMDEAEKIRISEKVSEVLHDLAIGQDQKFRAAARFSGFEENFIDLLERERRYSAAMREWDSYQAWKSERNQARSVLEAQFGYDTKHGMHLVRLMRMCREGLTGQGILVRRPDAKELLEIRNGSWSYDRLIAWAEEQDEDLKNVAATSTLPNSPNRVKLDSLCCQIVEMIDSKQQEALP